MIPMTLSEFEIMLTMISVIYPAYKITRLIINRNTEKHKLVKIICVTLFYEPFLVYDLIKWSYRKYQNKKILGSIILK